MTLTEQINDDIKKAMKAGDQVLLNTIRSLRAQILEYLKRDGANNITPEEELNILLSAAKKRKEAIEMYENAGRNDLADQEKRELEIITSYMPKQITKEEADEIITAIIANVKACGPQDFGKVMPLAMKELKGKIDGKIVQELVKAKLGQK